MTTRAEYEKMAKGLDWDGLRSLWEAVKEGKTPGWEPGKAFEYLVLRAFELDGGEVRWPYPVTLFGGQVEEIDGAVYACDLCCLVESKDLQQDVNVVPIAKLRNQLLRRPAGTIGLMFSSRRFTEAAVMLTYFAMPQTILLWDGDEVEYLLEKKKICGPLRYKYRDCVERGVPDCKIHEEGIG